MIIVDASAVVELLLRTQKGLRIAARLAEDGGPFRAPALVDPEVMQALRDLVRRGAIQLVHAEAALVLFADSPLQRVPHDVLLARMWALRDNLTSYDATYVALAELSKCTLLTCDGPLSRSPGHRATIELF